MNKICCAQLLTPFRDLSGGSGGAAADPLSTEDIEVRRLPSYSSGLVWSVVAGVCGGTGFGTEEAKPVFDFGSFTA